MTVPLHDPRAHAEHAARALRDLAHTSRSLDHPADTYPILGELLAGVRRLQQVLDQLADAHLTHRPLAATDDGDAAAGRQFALYAGDELRHAARSVRQAEIALDAAVTHSGRIAWRTPDPATPRIRPTSTIRRLDTTRPLHQLAPPDHAPAPGHAASRTTDPAGGLTL